MADKALVLGGGGSGGIGWLSGMLYGLFEAGVDLSDADVVIGTSAGSSVGAQLASGRLTLLELYQRQLLPQSAEPAGRLGPGAYVRYAWATLTSRTPEAYGRKIGRMALAARTQDEAARRYAIESRLASHEWPARPLRMPAVDTATGELRVFDKDSGVRLVDAMAASCAVPGAWPPVTVDGRRWMDGGTHSPANAHLAAGYGQVVVLAPVGAGGGPLVSAADQSRKLAEAGARVTVVTPDRAAKQAFGRNPLDPQVRAAAAHAGRTQAVAHAEEVAGAWQH
ncbi:MULTISPECIES: patatin-like phospholipase family protein [unclassified Streptomyces]|uniref:patatin-like phospholipase family protein n=1 Tax=unclassified Streptomyces TaxID=2593676 RepID=UPI002E802966|nr:patatin-like phospholipase family protein [Streptomyces sp. NBC_00589]WTI40889.1 patatin-like phospholipase family protein [Streptomyces sp. NBC_00775]WUB25427.1 patatin-like phospholipase family protein [Streptomyces sp. NBC_00589]